MTQITKKMVMELLPQIPFVMDQVSNAVNYVEEHTPDKLKDALALAYEVGKYAQKTSSEHYFKYDLIIMALLKHIGIDDLLKDKIIEVGSKVQQGLELLTITDDKLKEYGTAKATLNKLIEVYKTDKELLVVMFNELINTLEEAKEHLNKETILSIAIVEANLRLNRLELNNNINAYYLHLLKILNKLKF